MSSDRIVLLLVFVACFVGGGYLIGAGLRGGEKRARRASRESTGLISRFSRLKWIQRLRIVAGVIGAVLLIVGLVVAVIDKQGTMVLIVAGVLIVLAWVGENVEEVLFKWGDAEISAKKAQALRDEGAADAISVMSGVADAVADVIADAAADAGADGAVADAVGDAAADGAAADGAGADAVGDAVADGAVADAVADPVADPVADGAAKVAAAAAAMMAAADLPSHDAVAQLATTAANRMAHSQAWQKALSNLVVPSSTFLSPGALHDKTRVRAERMRPDLQGAGDFRQVFGRSGYVVDGEQRVIVGWDKSRGVVSYARMVGDRVTVTDDSLEAVVSEMTRSAATVKVFLNEYLPKVEGLLVDGLGPYGGCVEVETESSSTAFDIGEGSSEIVDRKVITPRNRGWAYAVLFENRPSADGDGTIGRRVAVAATQIHP